MLNTPYSINQGNSNSGNGSTNRTPSSVASIKNLADQFEKAVNQSGASTSSGNMEPQIKFANGFKESISKFVNMKVIDLSRNLRHVEADKVDVTITHMCESVKQLSLWYSTTFNLFMMSSMYYCLLESSEDFLDVNVVGRILFYLHADLMEVTDLTIAPIDKDATKAIIASEGKKPTIATTLAVIKAKLKGYSEDLKILALRKLSSDVTAANVKAGVCTIELVFQQITKDIRTIKVIDPNASITNEMLSLCFESYIKLLPADKIERFSRLQEKVIMKAAIQGRDVSRDKDVLEFIRLAEIEVEKCPDIKAAAISSPQVTALTAECVKDMINKSTSKLISKMKRERPSSDGSSGKSPKKGKYTPEERKQYCIHQIAKLYDLIEKKAPEADIAKVKGTLRRLKDVKLEESEIPPKPASMQGYFERFENEEDDENILNSLIGEVDVQELNVEAAMGEVQIATTDNNRGCFDTGCTKSIFKSTMNMQNKRPVTATVNGVTEGETGSVVQGSRADLPSICLANARHNLLAAKDVMEVSQSSVVLHENEAIFIDKMHVESWIQKVKKSKKIIQTIQRGENGLYEMDIPPTFKRGNDLKVLTALGAVVEVNQYDVQIDEYPSEGIEDLRNELILSQENFQALLSQAIEKDQQYKENIEAMLSRYSESLELDATSVKMLSGDEVEDDDLVFFRDGKFQNFKGEVLEGDNQIYCFRSDSIIESDHFPRTHKVLGHNCSIHELDGKVVTGTTKSLKRSRKIAREHYKRCECCSIIKDKLPVISKGKDELRDTRPTEPMQTIWLDCLEKQGPVFLQLKYFWLIVDEFSNYVWILATKDKDDNGDFGLQWRLWLKENNKGKTIKYVHHDMDGTLRSPLFKSICLLNGGIVSTPTPSHQHFLNGKVERPIHTIRNMANAYRKEKNVPNFLQFFALKFAVHAYNRVLHTTSGKLSDKTPYEMIYGKKPDLSHMYIPFSVCYSHIYSGNKEDDKARLTIFCGYSTETRRRRCYDVLYYHEITNKLTVVKNIYNPKFDERRGFGDIYPAVVEQHKQIDSHLTNSDRSGYRHINPGEVETIVNDDIPIELDSGNIVSSIENRYVNELDDSNTNNVDVDVLDSDGHRSGHQEQVHAELMPTEDATLTTFKNFQCHRCQEKFLYEETLHLHEAQICPLREQLLEEAYGDDKIIDNLLTKKNKRKRAHKRDKRQKLSNDKQQASGDFVPVEVSDVLDEAVRIPVETETEGGETVIDKEDNVHGQQPAVEQPVPVQNLKRRKSRKADGKVSTVSSDKASKKAVEKSGGSVKKVGKKKRKKVKVVQSSSSTHAITEEPSTRVREGKRLGLRSVVKSSSKYEANVTTVRTLMPSISYLMGCIFALSAASEETVNKEIDQKLEDKVLRKIAPKSTAEIMIRSDRQIWETATVDELKNHNGSHIDKSARNETFNEVTEEDNYDYSQDRLHRLVWVYEYRSSGPKARLCFDGSSEEEEVDFAKMYATSSVVSQTTTRLAMSYAAHHKMQDRQIDIKAAYLYTRLPDDIEYLPKFHMD